jgi:hypothetical protein
MERKLSELDLQTVILFQFLDTPGDEIAPGSDEVGKDLEDERFRHGFLLRIRMLNRSETPERF